MKRVFLVKWFIFIHYFGFIISARSRWIDSLPLKSGKNEIPRS